MAHEWRDLTGMTQGEPFLVERVRMTRTGIAVEGAFAPPPLALLSAEDQVFVAAFVRAHGSIKEVERLFGVSYPTVKGRLNRIAGALPFVDVAPPEEPREDVLSELEAGRIDVDEALRRLGK